MIWLIAALDLVVAVWLLRRALPRERRDRDGVLVVGLLLLLCAAILVGIGVWRATLEPDEPGLPPAEPVPGISVRSGEPVGRPPADVRHPDVAGDHHQHPVVTAAEHPGRTRLAVVVEKGQDRGEVESHEGS